MRVPLEIIAEWKSFTTSHDREGNLRSLAILRDWLAGVEEYLEAGGDPDKQPTIYGHATSNVRGLTHPDFDGASTTKLRFWLDWWSKPERSKHGAEEAGRDPEDEVAKIQREIDARN